MKEIYNLLSEKKTFNTQRIQNSFLEITGRLAGLLGEKIIFSGTEFQKGS